MITVELVYVPLNKPPVKVQLTLESGASIFNALQQSGWSERFPEIDQLPVGIFSKPATFDTVLKDGDRVEFYRPLRIDPKTRRRQQAKKQ